MKKVIQTLLVTPRTAVTPYLISGRSEPGQPGPRNASWVMTQISKEATMAMVRKFVCAHCQQEAVSRLFTPSTHEWDARNRSGAFRGAEHLHPRPALKWEYVGGPCEGPPGKPQGWFQGDHDYHLIYEGEEADAT